MIVIELLIAENIILVGVTFRGSQSTGTEVSEGFFPTTAVGFLPRAEVETWVTVADPPVKGNVKFGGWGSNDPHSRHMRDRGFGRVSGFVEVTVVVGNPGDVGGNVERVPFVGKRSHLKKTANIVVKPARTSRKMNIRIYVQSHVNTIEGLGTDVFDFVVKQDEVFRILV